MSYPAYPEYKDSGVEWLGEVPAHWEIKPLKYVATYNDEVLLESTPDNYPIKYVEISDVDEQLGITGWSEHFFSSAPSRARRVLKDGDVLISTVRTYLRAIAPVTEPPANLIGSTGFAVIRPIPCTYDSTLLGYVVRAEWFISNIIARSVGVSYPAINASDLVALSLPIPPWKEQKVIATFLDHETARIDALVEEQQRLIALLKEKRQAVISHAVTKGLDPEVPMKDSGVEWLGAVPEHWGHTFIKHCCYINDGNHGEEYPKGDDFIDDADNGIPFIRGGNLKNMTVTTEGMLYITVEKNDSMRKGRLQVGDILFVNRGEIGKLAIVPPTMNGANLNSQIAYLRVENEIIDPHYLALYLLSNTVKAEIKAAQEGSVLTQYPIGDLAAIYIPVPPKSEQRKVSNFLNEQLHSFNVLIAETLTNIELLFERRSALISAAVTGKIDVRGWQPPEGANAKESSQQEGV